MWSIFWKPVLTTAALIAGISAYAYGMNPQNQHESVACLAALALAALTAWNVVGHLKYRRDLMFFGQFHELLRCGMLTPPKTEQRPISRGWRCLWFNGHLDGRTYAFGTIVDVQNRNIGYQLTHAGQTRSFQISNRIASDYDARMWLGGMIHFTLKRLLSDTATTP